MALFLIERNYAERVQDATIDEEEEMFSVNDELGVQWINTFLSTDRTCAYCLYESPSSELLLEHARILGIPADQIIEVTSTI